jgi:hypothetical protein
MKEWAMGAREIFEELKSEGWALVKRWVDEHKEESLYLEFKRARFDSKRLGDRERKALAKALSGFANTDGGVIVFGIESKRDSDSDVDRAERLGAIANVERFRDQVRDEVRRVCVPEPLRWEVHHVPDPEEPRAGMVAVFVPASVGVHRATEAPDVGERYFLRTSAGTSPIPHALLATMFGRRPAPLLRVRLKRLKPSQVEIIVENIGRGTAHFVSLRIWLRDDAGKPVHPGAVPGEGWMARRGVVGERSAFGVFRVQGEPPLFAMDRSLAATVDLGQLLDRWTIGGRVDCEDGMPVEFEGPVPSAETRVAVLPPDENASLLGPGEGSR